MKNTGKKIKLEPNKEKECAYCKQENATPMIKGKELIIGIGYDDTKKFPALCVVAKNGENYIEEHCLINNCPACGCNIVKGD